MTDAYEIVRATLELACPLLIPGGYSREIAADVVKALRDSGKLAKSIEDQMERDMRLVRSGFEEGREFGREELKASLFATPTLEELGQRFRSGALRTP